MPKEIKYIECECEGKLSEIAKTQTDYGMQYGDPAYTTYFFQCDKCEGIFFVVGGEKDYDASRIKKYEGRLNAEQIKKYISCESGWFMDFQEERILKKITNLSKSEFEGTIAFKDGKPFVKISGEIPEELAGISVKIIIPQ